MKLSVAPAAQHELIEAAKFYAERAGEDFGLALIAEFEHALSLLSDNPELGASWQGSARRLPLRRFIQSHLSVEATRIARNCASASA